MTLPENNGIVINKERIKKNFIDLASINSPSLKERQVADAIKKLCAPYPIAIYEDKGGEVYGGNCGNVYLTLEEDFKGLVPDDLDSKGKIFSAHMDTVTPCDNKVIVQENNIIKTDGNTILGGDDLCGVVSILEALFSICENNMPHPKIEAVFTIGEELSLCGAKVLEYERITGKHAFVMDSDNSIGTAANIGPSQYIFTTTIFGKAAHAGIEPEKGISAIEIAAKAISNMKLGRIDEETTANVGVISGGKATNIVCDKVTVKSEARSINWDKLINQTEHMISTFENVALEAGGSAQTEKELEYSGYNIDINSETAQMFVRANSRIGIKTNFVYTGGGSDTNIFNKMGISAIDVACGMRNVHSLDEYIDLNDLYKCAEQVIALATLNYN